MKATQDIIIINDLKVQCIIGILEQERRITQPLLISVEIKHDLRLAATTEDIAHTLDYFSLAEEIQNIAVAGKFFLIERLTESIAAQILVHSTVEAVSVTVKKPQAIPDAAQAAVSITRIQQSNSAQKKETQLIAVINVSPESPVKSSISNNQEILKIAKAHQQNGANWIDIGARSTNPDIPGPSISEDEEWARLMEPLSKLLDAGYLVSVDTWSASTAIKALNHGAQMINFTGQELPAALLDLANQKQSHLVVTYMPAKSPASINEATELDWSSERIIAYFSNLKSKLRQWPHIKLLVDPNLGILPDSIRNDEYKKIILQLATIKTIPRIKSLGLNVFIACPRKLAEYSLIFFAQILLEQQVEFIRIHFPKIIKHLLALGEKHKTGLA